MELKEAIKAINDGKKLTHDFLHGKSIGRYQQFEAIHDVVHGWDDIIDPLHEGTIYYKEIISPVEIFDVENKSLGQGGIHFSWIDDPDKRGIPVDGWEFLGVKI